MFSHLQIPRARDRLLVGLADLALWPLGWRRPGPASAPQRILLLRLERIGDLLMTLDAIRQVRASAPSARIDLAVGSWNAELAALVPGIGTVHVVDVPWLARETPGVRWRTLVAAARQWRGTYDLVINFEPDIRSNILAWLSDAPSRVGYRTGGGGALLTRALAYEPADHVAANADRLVRSALGPGTATRSDQPVRLEVPDDARREAEAVLAGAVRPLIGIHASGGRASKQWHPERFAEAGVALATAHAATLVLTGASADRVLVDQVRAGLGATSVIDVCGALGLTTLAAVLEQLDLLVTGDTGPMHLAAAVGTPVVALFGPSDPRRYGPLGAVHQVLRVDLPCSPCGLVRLPPVRCRGRVPECLDSIPTARVVAAAADVLGR